MKIPFTKLHGAKNDFLLTLAADVPVADPEAIAIAICDRYTGVGADGWMIVDPTPGGTPGEDEYDATIRLFNSDGSEPELSGNGTRCAALLLIHQHPKQILIRTGAGIKHLKLISQTDTSEYLYEMNMGQIKVLELNATVQGRDAILVDAGNPQCAMPVADFNFDWRALGKAVENDPRFLKRTNVSFIRTVDSHTIDVRFWERGAGETNSSGTGSTGATIAAIARGLVTSPVTILTPAGPLTIRVENGIWLTGPAAVIAEGFFHYGRIGIDE